MSPEQARGKAGRQAHRHLGVRLRALRDADRPTRRSPATTISDTLARDARARAGLDRAAGRDAAERCAGCCERCLEKDAERRLRDIGDARIELDDALGTERSPAAATGAQPVIGVGARSRSWLLSWYPRESPQRYCSRAPLRPPSNNSLSAARASAARDSSRMVRPSSLARRAKETGSKYRVSTSRTVRCRARSTIRYQRSTGRARGRTCAVAQSTLRNR